jgi:fatty-acyl-CoA synthase
VTSVPLVEVPSPGRFDPLAWWAHHDPARVAVVDPARGMAHGYGTLHERADAWASMLARRGVASGDRVALLATNRIEHLVLLAACTRLGAALVPLNWRLAPAEQARVLADALPTVLLGEARFRADAVAAERLGAGGSVAWVDLDDAAEAPPASTRPPRGPVASETPAMLVYTSGSTGVPKGVIVPHRQLHWNAFATITSWELSARDVAPLATPLFHTAGWGVFTLPLLAAGGRLVLLDGFEPDALLETLREEAVTVAFAVPTQLDVLRTRPAWGEPLPALRWFLAGGAPCPQRVHNAVWEAGYRFREGYGLTECGPNCFTTTTALARARPGTVGHPLQHLGMRLVDADGALIADDRVGELQLRGPQMFGGYFNAPARTRAVLTADGWLQTGDLACRTPDGVWAIRGRRREMFISGGENVFPGEVEAALLHCRGVGQAAVIGVPDAMWGEVGCALVVPAIGHEGVSVPSLLAELRGRLAGYKVPREVLLVTALPLLGSGKVDRRALLALAHEARRGRLAQRS